MTSQESLFRRDALKLLGAAAGATVLANLPAKWSTPEITAGVLPAHALTSAAAFTILNCALEINPLTGQWSSSATMSTPEVTIVCFKITLVGMSFSACGSAPNPLESNWTAVGGTVAISNGHPVWSRCGNIKFAPVASGSFTIEWYDCQDPSQSCSRTASWPT